MNDKNKHLIFSAALFLIGVLAFGLQLFRLGFYLDDWVIVQAFNQDGVNGILRYALGDSRPFVAWVWIVGYSLFGSQPVLWQVYSLAFRLLTAFAAWLLLDRFFKKQMLQAVGVALLFFVYPIFKQQATSLAFVHHWIAFSFFLLSIFFQLKALDRPRYLNLYLLLALGLNAVQLFTNEYFIALELARPLIIGLDLYSRGSAPKSFWKKLAGVSLPFLGLFLAYLAWRFWLVDLPVEDRNTPYMIQAFLTSPLFAIRRWTEMLLQSLIEAFVGSWYHALDPNAVLFKPLSNAAGWIITLITSIALCAAGWLLSQKDHSKPAEDDSKRNGITLLVGFILMVLGFIPGWGIERTIADPSGMYNDRFGLASALGCSLVVVALLEWLVKSPRARLVLLSVLIGIGVGYQYRIETDYANSWSRQKDFNWQLLNRAPGLQPNTAIISNGVIAKYVGSWADTSAINQLYDPHGPAGQIAYWYYAVGDIPFDYLQQYDFTVTERKKFLAFDGSLRDSVVIMKPGTAQCLWVLDDDDRSNPYVESSLLNYIPFSQPGRILPDASTPYREAIWGRPPQNTWCTYFQKAKLAQQQKDWPQVISFYDQAQAQGFSPRSPVEYAPFIEAFGMQQQWDQAAALTDLARKPIESPYYPLENYLCTTVWKRIQTAFAGQPDAAVKIDPELQKLGCSR